MFVLEFLLALLGIFIRALIMGLLVWWLIPDTGINYEPTFAQAFILALLISGVVGNYSSSKEN